VQMMFLSFNNNRVGLSRAVDRSGFASALLRSGLSLTQCPKMPHSLQAAQPGLTRAEMRWPATRRIYKAKTHSAIPRCSHRRERTITDLFRLAGAATTEAVAGALPQGAH
jgi:hypothetical protein